MVYVSVKIAEYTWAGKFAGRDVLTRISHSKQFLVAVGGLHLTNLYGCRGTPAQDRDGLTRL